MNNTIEINANVSANAKSAEEIAEAFGVNHEEMASNPNINISNHAYERFVERITGITDAIERRRYINENKERITKEINALWKFAKYVWQGQLYENITRKYWLRDNIVIVTDTQTSNIVTLYKINYSWGEEMDRFLANKTLAEIEKQRDELESLDSVIRDEIDRIDNDIEIVEADVRALEERLAFMKSTVQAKKDERSLLFLKTQPLKKELEANLHRICNSLEYSREVRGANNSNNNGGRR